MNKKIILFLSIFSIALMGSSCPENPTEPEDPVPTATAEAAATSTPVPGTPPPTTPTFTPTPTPFDYQNFEISNGTPGDYFWDGMPSSAPAFVGLPFVHTGTRGLEINPPGAAGGAVAVNPQSVGNIDLSNADKVYAWIYDTTGSNTVNLLIWDNNEGSAMVQSTDDGVYTTTTPNQWTLISWPLSSAAFLTLSEIMYVEVIVRTQGTVYIDDITYY
ncbi:hypothetical protein K8S19_03465 [bacterium]|nr:hypothetical protein [bacterium]